MRGSITAAPPGELYVRRRSLSTSGDVYWMKRKGRRVCQTPGPWRTPFQEVLAMSHSTRLTRVLAALRLAEKILEIDAGPTALIEIRRLLGIALADYNNDVTPLDHGDRLYLDFDPRPPAAKNGV